MTIWTVHLRRGHAPVLVREGFCWAALAFGPLWLLANRAWIAAVLLVAAWLLIGELVPIDLREPIVLATIFAVGLFGRDIVRWTLARRGFVLGQVLAARDVETAYGRLIATNPDMAAAIAGPYA